MPSSWPRRRIEQAGVHGENSFRAPMGGAVIGGLLASTALSLFVVPVLYTLMDGFEHRLKKLFGRVSGRANREGAAEAQH